MRCGWLSWVTRWSIEISCVCMWSNFERSSGSMVHAEVGDARDLNLPDSSVDAVVLLGPLYHLRKRTHRVQALREASRVVRPGGPVFAAVISRWAPRLDGVVAERLYESYPEVLATVA